MTIVAHLVAIPFKQYYMSCPKCNNKMKFERSGNIEINCNSKGEVRVPGLYKLVTGCKNPLCEWSKVEGIDTYY